jgi:GntR family carbon starvation induced transcriptional regulator
VQNDGNALRPGRKETLASTIYERVREGIITGSFPPGEKLHIQTLCDEFDVGLSPIREALSRLSTEGFVSRSDHRGFAVKPLSEGDLVDLTRARCWLNETALRQSIANGDAAWEEAVVIAFHRLSRTPRYDGPNHQERSRAWERAHRVFHATLISASGSKRVERYCEHLFDSAERYRHVARRAGLLGSSREREHRDIMEATVARQADAAVRLLNGHFEHTADLVRQLLAASYG